MMTNENLICLAGAVVSHISNDENYVIEGYVDNRIKRAELIKKTVEHSWTYFTAFTDN